MSYAGTAVRLTVLALVVTAHPVAGQSIRVGLTAVGLRTMRETAEGTIRLQGTGIGGEAQLSRSVLALNVRYYEGSLSEKDGPLGRDIVEGEAIAVIRPVRWFGIALGPHVRSFLDSTSTERWFFWEGRLLAEAQLLGPAIRGYLEGWRVLSANVNVPEQFDSGVGIDGGLIFRFRRWPVVVRLRYRSERMKLGSGARLETAEQLGLVVGIRRGG
jgi:hypothetical protein